MAPTSSKPKPKPTLEPWCTQRTFCRTSLKDNFHYKTNIKGQRVSPLTAYFMSGALNGLLKLTCGLAVKKSDERVATQNAKFLELSSQKKGEEPETVKCPEKITADDIENACLSHGELKRLFPVQLTITAPKRHTSAKYKKEQDEAKEKKRIKKAKARAKAGLPPLKPRTGKRSA
jgi:hypothetical protein